MSVRTADTGAVLVEDGETEGFDRSDRRLPEPNFFIVGAPRAGTTSLWYRIRQHPEVFMPLEQKEPHFFCDNPRPWAVKDIDDYLKLFAGAGTATAIGEASAGYLCAPESPAQISRRYPHAKIIIMLRDPAERAYSLYRLSCSFGLEWLSTFEKALAAEDRRFADQGYRKSHPFQWDMHQYFRSALAAEAVERYLNVFHRDQIHVIVFDDYKKDSNRCIRDVFEFLGVDPTFRADADSRNEAGFPWWVRGHYLVGQLWEKRIAARGSGRPGTAEKYYGALWKINLALGEAFRPSSLAPETRARLKKRYAADVEATAALVGRDLSAWLP